MFVIIPVNLVFDFFTNSCQELFTYEHFIFALKKTNITNHYSINRISTQYTHLMIAVLLTKILYKHMFLKCATITLYIYILINI